MDNYEEDFETEFDIEPPPDDLQEEDILYYLNATGITKQM
jgi:hypothetical protein